jgi:hypothetical protein
METLTHFERSSGKTLTVHSVSGSFSEYYVTREGDGDLPVFDTDEQEIAEAIERHLADA